MAASAGSALHERLHTRADRLRWSATEMSLAVFLLACYGTTTIVTLGKIFSPVRKWIAARSPTAGVWVKCAMCFGFAVGVFWAVVGLWPRTGLVAPVDYFAAGTVSSGWCWVLRVVLHRLGEDEL